MLVAVDGRWKVEDHGLHHLPLVCGSDGHVYSNFLELEHAKYITGAEGNKTSETV
jgi:hypothetical protein